MGERDDPFQLVFAPFVPDRFEAMRKSLEQDEVDPFARDAWTVSRPGVELLHELRPDGGLGEGVEELVALAHAAFLFWQQGERVAVVNRSVLDAVVRGASARSGGAGPRSAYYVALAPRRVWGTPVPGEPAEPLEGWFTVADHDQLTLVAVFGLLMGRPGFTAVQVSGPPRVNSAGMTKPSPSHPSWRVVPRRGSGRSSGGKNSVNSAGASTGV